MHVAKMEAVKWWQYTAQQLEKKKSKRAGSGPDDKSKNKALLAIKRARDLQKALHESTVKHMDCSAEPVQLPEAKTPDKAAKSVYPECITLLLANDGGANEDTMTFVPLVLADFLVTSGYKYNRASDDIQLTKVSASFAVSAGLADKVSKKKQKEAECDVYKKPSACACATSAPRRFSNPLSQEPRVAWPS